MHPRLAVEGLGEIRWITESVLGRHLGDGDPSGDVVAERAVKEESTLLIFHHQVDFVFPGSARR